ncbi:MAG TPA: tetratricopeptide repeat protein [Gemmataceae bacterium]|nr:tetratricopeptide repeat protein [Gemmataceae bacterium]
MFETACLGLALALGLAHASTPSSSSDAKSAGEKLPISGLMRAKLVPGLCLVKYRVSTASPECQEFFDQGLGYYYSYVWMEAVRSFETATQYDPECALAWWGLSRALERWGKGNPKQALQKANDLRTGASHREQLLIRARVQEKGLSSDGDSKDKDKQAAIRTIDELLTLYDDDEEGWYYRAQLAGGSGLFGGQLSSAPFYKALWRINPLHPGANHELLHFYESQRRPALGWLYAENYIRSSPGIPHAFHMQAHLATRLGRWDKTSDRSAHAIELERAYHKQMNVQPKDDAQFSHHLEILTLSLIHDGRFHEASAIKEEAKRAGIHHWLPWFRLALAQRDWAEAFKVVDHFRKSDKPTASYLAALVYLKQGDLGKAAPEVEVLRNAYAEHKDNKTLEERLMETQGVLLCRQGACDTGLSLLAKIVDRTKNDYSHHAWGNGSYLMEVWGIAALHAHKVPTAEEAFLEALAHDPGSVRAALGLQVLCERLGRTEEARRYAELAQRNWRKADAPCLTAELLALRGESFSRAPPPPDGNGVGNAQGSLRKKGR